MEDRRIEVYDIETLAGCYTYSGYNIDTKEVKQFVIHESRNDLIEMVNHIKSLKGMVGYNNLSFDYPIIHFILKEYTKWGLLSNQEIIDKIYNKAQEIINKQDSRDKFSHLIRSKDMFVEQMDLFKMWHFDNKARRTSLKSLEISMNYPNVMDMPISHIEKNITIDQIDEVLEYNLNDVMATYKFFLLSKDKIELRKGLKQKYGLDCINYSDSKIGESLVLDLYSKAIKCNIWDIKSAGGTYNDCINLNECIFDYIEFKTDIFKSLLDNLKSKVVTGTKEIIEESIIYKGFKYDYGLGGIHGCIKPGIYESNDKYIIIDADVASLYPSIAVQNKLFPAHLGEEFCEVYEDILNQRIAAKKAGNMTMSDGFKLSLNSVYGKSNDQYSFLMDNKYTIKTTINGQLMLTMLCEDLVENIEDLIMLQVNTDGLTVKIKKSDYNKYLELCKQWEIKTKLSLEYVEYSKMIIRDVNNYIAVSTKGKVKYKGTFELNKELHKDNSDKIVAMAISEYFINNIPVERTIKNHDNIYDFCARQKFIGDDYGVTTTVEYKDGEYRTITEKQQKNVRYYISNKGSSFTKYYTDGSTEIIAGGYQVKVFNKYIKKDIKDYDINYQYYIQEANKIINTIIDNQLTLF